MKNYKSEVNGVGSIWVMMLKRVNCREQVLYIDGASLEELIGVKEGLQLNESAYDVNQSFDHLGQLAKTGFLVTYNMRHWYSAWIVMKRVYSLFPALKALQDDMGSGGPLTDMMRSLYIVYVTSIEMFSRKCFIISYLWFKLSCIPNRNRPILWMLSPSFIVFRTSIHPPI